MTSKAFGLAQLGNAYSDGALSNRNKIINGDMRIDQRNAGAAVNMTTAVFPVDRWVAFEDTDGAMTAQRSTVAPAGFVNSILCSTTTADASLTGAQYARVFQNIEGFNSADLIWGTASAQPITVSFWVRSSLTGTFGGAISNGAFNRSYPFTYNINAANTWEYKSVSIAGDTSGTWLTDNGIGVILNFSLGTGTTYSGTAGAWAGSGLLSATDTISVIGTLNATWQITGVQLEPGDTATPFEHRSFGQELALCQRYYFKTFPQGTAPAQNVGSSNGALFGGPSVTNVSFIATQKFPTTMRTAPTVTTFSPNATSANWTDQAGAIPTAVVLSAGDSQVSVRGTTSTLAGGAHSIHLTASAEL